MSKKDTLLVLALVGLMGLAMGCKENSSSVEKTSLPPSSSRLAPPTSTLTPPSSRLAPLSSTLAPPTSTLTPPSSRLAPLSSTLPPPSSTLTRRNVGASAQAEPITERAHVLVGHWRKTTIVFEEPKDEHLVLKANGAASTWVETASSRSPKTIGTWSVEGKNLTLLLAGSMAESRPFTIYQGQLVFPNIQNQRSFWEKIAN